MHIHGLFSFFAISSVVLLASAAPTTTNDKRIAISSSIPALPTIPGHPTFVCGCTNDCIVNCKVPDTCWCTRECQEKYLCQEDAVVPATTNEKRIVIPSSIPAAPARPSKRPFTCGCTNDCQLDCKVPGTCFCTTECQVEYLCPTVEGGSKGYTPQPPAEPVAGPKPKAGCWQECMASCPKGKRCNCLAVQCPGWFSRASHNK
ncbi:hypothetical protein BJ508DRAFT_14880 [Ascobolus immersus RN42]|uniref:Uncharacterized protein n=1 Tax=Ascobolus immersus RN42 TaxID=1160509 RepID=A0A3N4HRM6_ASCIM|nr:hypothetical protein BJ508DRAFT_14880 [Ascobolus immersus RN42]